MTHRADAILAVVIRTRLQALGGDYLATEEATDGTAARHRVRWPDGTEETAEAGAILARLNEEEGREG